MSDRQINPITKALLATKEALSSKDKWCRFKQVNSKGQLCLVGAIHRVANKEDRVEIFDILTGATEELYSVELKPENRAPRHYDDFNHPVTYNSCPYVYVNNYLGFEAVHKILDRAIQKSLTEVTVTA